MALIHFIRSDDELFTVDMPEKLPVRWWRPSRKYLGE